jgi:hypothetical protein
MIRYGVHNETPLFEETIIYYLLFIIYYLLFIIYYLFIVN